MSAPRILHLDLAPRATRADVAAFDDAWAGLARGALDALLVAHPGHHRARVTAGIFPGSFNPLHDGHGRIARIAQERGASPLGYELSIANVDKPDIAKADGVARLAQFADGDAVWLTRSPTFAEKARIFPGVTFVIGADTAARIGDPRYYPDRAARDRALAAVAAAGCRFLVFGRLVDRRFATLEEVDMPAALRALCDGVEEAEFRVDVSSSALREGRGSRRR